MNKQEVLEKIILHLTNQPCEHFFTQVKDKYFLNTQTLEDFSNKTKRRSMSQNGRHDDAIKMICQDYYLKKISFKDFKSELDQILQNISLERDKKLSSIKPINKKRLELESEITCMLELLQRNLSICNISLFDLDQNLYLSDYEKFILKPCNNVLCGVKIKNNTSFIDSFCNENTLRFVLENHYDEFKKQIEESTTKKIDKNDKNEKKNNYFQQLKNFFLTVSKEELFISLQDWWKLKIKLEILYYVPPTRQETRPLSFFFIVEQLRVNNHMIIDPYLYQTILTFSNNYGETAIEEFREYYKCVFGDNLFRKNFISKTKELKSWIMYRILFINICIVSNKFLFGELLRTWTKEHVMYPHKNYKLDKKYPSFIDTDITNQKILSNIETQNDIDKLLSIINTFDNNNELSDEFIEKHPSLIYNLFDAYEIQEEKKN